MMAVALLAPWSVTACSNEQCLRRTVRPPQAQHKNNMKLDSKMGRSIVADLKPADGGTVAGTVATPGAPGIPDAHSIGSETVADPGKASVVADVDNLGVIPFPTNHLTGSLQGMVREVAEEIGVSEALSACCGLATVSAAIGAGLQVRYRDEAVFLGPDHVTSGNLYVMAGTKSGPMSSRCFKEMTGPLYAVNADMVRDWKENVLPRLGMEIPALQAEIKKLKEDMPNISNGAPSAEWLKIMIALKRCERRLAEAQSQLVQPTLLCEDVTMEVLMKLMSENRETLACFNPDAGAAINNELARYGRPKRADDNVFIKAHAGDCLQVDRVNREQIVLKNPCLTVLWLVEPDNDTLLDERALIWKGLLPPFLVCHSCYAPLPVPEIAAGVPPETRAAYEKLMRDLVAKFRTRVEPFIVDAEDAALIEYRQFFDKMLRRWEPLDNSKYYASLCLEQARRLGAVLHAAKYGADADTHPLELATAFSAIKVADWFAEEQLANIEANWMRLMEKRRNEVVDLAVYHERNLSRNEYITVENVYDAGIVTDAFEAQALLEQMVEEGILDREVHTPPRGGWKLRFYTLTRRKSGVA